VLSRLNPENDEKGGIIIGKGPHTLDDTTKRGESSAAEKSSEKQGGEARHGRAWINGGSGNSNGESSPNPPPTLNGGERTCRENVLKYLKSRKETLTIKKWSPSPTPSPRREKGEAGKTGLPKCQGAAKGLNSSQLTE